MKKGQFAIIVALIMAFGIGISCFVYIKLGNDGNNNIETIKDNNSSQVSTDYKNNSYYEENMKQFENDAKSKLDNMISEYDKDWEPGVSHAYRKREDNGITCYDIYNSVTNDVSGRCLVYTSSGIIKNYASWTIATWKPGNSSKYEFTVKNIDLNSDREIASSDLLKLFNISNEDFYEKIREYHIKSINNYLSNLLSWADEDTISEVRKNVSNVTQTISTKEFDPNDYKLFIDSNSNLVAFVNNDYVNKVCGDGVYGEGIDRTDRVQINNH